MTYIKPEADLNQSLTKIQEILHLGYQAAQQENWILVNNYLKQLPQTKSRKKAKRFILNQDDWQSAFDLALLILIKAEFQDKWEITKLLPLFGDNIIPTLNELIKNPTTEADVRWFICQVLSNFNHASVILTLVELLDSTQDQELIEIAGKSLIKIGDDAIDALENMLTKPQHRFLAAQSLYYIRTAKTIEPLLKIATDPDPALKTIAIKALGSFHDARIPPILINALQDKASNVRQEAIIALGFRPDICQDFDLVNHLCPLLFDLNLEVCCQTAISLGRMKNEAAATAIFETLQTETTPLNLKLDLVKALAWSEISLAIDYLAIALTTSEVAVTAEIIIVLGRTNISKLKSQAAQVLINFWQKQSEQLTLPQLRQSLANSLGDLRCESGRITLEQLAQDSDRKVKLHALSALKKINYK